MTPLDVDVQHFGVRSFQVDTITFGVGVRKVCWPDAYGFQSENVIEVEGEYSSQVWHANAEISVAFDRLMRAVANENTSTEELRRAYKTLRYSPFPDKAGPEEQRGSKLMKWISGMQAYKTIHYQIIKSPKYGNRFSAHFTD